MGKFAIISAAIFCGAFMLSASAEIVSHVDKVEFVDGKRVYTFTIDSWDYQDSTPNPCYKDERCSIALSHRHSAEGTSGIVFTGWAGISCISDSKSIGELGICLRDHPSNARGDDGNGVVGVKLTTPFSGTTFHGGNNTYVAECIGFFYGPVPAIVQGKKPLPSSICGTAPPINVQCNIVENEISINHGTKTGGILNGDVASSNFSVDCQGGGADVSLLFSNMPNGFLTLSDSVKTKFTINDRPSGDHFNVIEGRNDFIIKSTLSVNGEVQPGGFENTSIMTLSYQ